MTSRISTSGMHSAAIAEILAQQSKLSRTQSQVASGLKIQAPADDPIGATRILDLERTRLQLSQYSRNADMATNRLNVTEQALTDAGSILQRVRELGVQANSAALDSSSRAAIATELRTRVQELQDVGNRRDAADQYLFSGFSTQTQAFSRGASGVTYAGDQGVRALQISPDQRVGDGLSGQQVFMNVPEGNGTFTAVTGIHTGTGTIDSGQVVNAPSWVAGDYTVRFTAPSAWEVVDAGSTVIASGSYVAGSAISFNGIQVTITGSPAAGDTFSIAPAGKKSLFDAIDDLITTLGTHVDDPESRSRLNSEIGASLTQLDQGLTQVINSRADIGARLSAIDSAATSRQALDFELSGSIGELKDLDYAEAISRMNQQLVGLQAAQAAYTRISQLSLFDYL
jgi:flagellar hook-associated protein 3 FlgL